MPIVAFGENFEESPWLIEALESRQGMLQNVLHNEPINGVTRVTRIDSTLRTDRACVTCSVCHVCEVAANANAPPWLFFTPSGSPEPLGQRG